MLSMVRLHSVQELLTTCRVPNVLHTQADTLLDVSVSNDFVHDDTNGMRCNVVHDACAAVTYGIYECKHCSCTIEHTHGSICGAYPFVVQN
jgi:hypothetical protein